MIVVREIDGRIPIFREFRDSDGGALRCIHNAHGVEGVPVHPHDILLIERRGTAEMIEPVHAAGHFGDHAKLSISFSPYVAGVTLVEFMICLRFERDG